MVEQTEKLKITYFIQSMNSIEDVIVSHIFNVCRRIHPNMLACLDYAAKNANRAVEIDKLHSSDWIQETSRNKPDDEEIDMDVALSVVNFHGKYRRFGKVGHKAKDCTNLNGSNLNPSRN